jgi:hypothetical protein
MLRRSDGPDTQVQRDFTAAGGRGMSAAEKAKRVGELRSKLRRLYAQREIEWRAAEDAGREIDRNNDDAEMKGVHSMTDGLITEQVIADVRWREQSRAIDIIHLCVRHGCPHRAVDLIRSNATLSEARVRLQHQPVAPAARRGRQELEEAASVRLTAQRGQ